MTHKKFLAIASLLILGSGCTLQNGIGAHRN